MSHELRTSLNAIIGLSETMYTNAARFGTEKAQEPPRRVHAAGTHLLGRINQVLDLSKKARVNVPVTPVTDRGLLGHDAPPGSVVASPGP
jgi:signal transduction histidine kinase